MTSWSEGWELLVDDGTVHPVVVPGTVAQAVGDLDADLRTWVFRTTVREVPAGPVDLVLEGVATSYAVVLDGTVLLTCQSMHAAHRLDVTSLVHKGSVLEIRCLPLVTALPQPRPARARWRSRLVEDNDLRLIRTTLLGRCPGIAPGPPVVGPYREVRLETRRPEVRLRTRLEAATGVLTVTGAPPDAVVHCAGVTGPPGELRIPEVELWWPHTHGEPTLHDVNVTVDDATTLVGRVGFRSVVNVDPSSLDLVVNGVPVWVRGAVWTPPGLLAGLPEDPTATVLLARDAGMNLLRVPGLAPYETAAFLAACDAAGILVWHDLALANLDVPHDLLDLDAELSALLARAEGHPCLAVVCGGSETAQQVAMLGLDPTLWRTPFLDEVAPRLVGDRAVWVPNSPCGEPLPFRVGSGVAHYFGVGGYRRPLSDVRAAGVLFAAECLAFAQGEVGWVPRDNGSDWDFADVTAHYADLLERPVREVPGELMASVFGEWRRAASPNRGGLVLWLRDLQRGSNWGVLDADGRPKPSWWHLRRSLAAQAVWLTDEGLDGLAVHLANDSPDGWEGLLRVTVYRDDDLLLEESTTSLTVPGHGGWSGDVEGLLGRFSDLSWAYRFGEPSAACVVATFEDGTGTPPQVFAFPLTRPSVRHPREVLTVERDQGAVVLTSTRLLDSVVVASEGRPSDNHFCLEPGRAHRVLGADGPVSVSALNLDGDVVLRA